MNVAEREPWHLALYSQTDASMYADVPLSTVHRWFGAEEVASAERLATFDDLVTLLFVRELRRRGVPLKDIRAAEMDLRERTGHQHPFAHESLWVAGRDILVLVDATRRGYLSPNRRGQLALPEITQPVRVELPRAVAPVRGELTYASGRVAIWRPTEGIAAQPAIQFGLTCIEGTRLPTKDIYQANLEGDSIERLAGLYAVTETEVRRAVECETKLAA